MSLIEPVIRPPSEANSFLLQVTMGCSANSCTFCGAYQGKAFRVKDIKEIEADIEEGARYYPETRRVFLCDGDALVMKNEKLVPILKKIQKAFPKLTKISSYANAQNILAKSEEELKELVANKLNLIFIGLESGSEKVLKDVKKKADPEQMIEAVRKAQAAGMKNHIIVLLGLAQKSGSLEHAKASAEVINQMQPRYLSLLSLMFIPGTELFNDLKAGKFKELSPQELLQETFWVLEDLELERTIFRADHASNYVPLEGRLPKDKEVLLSLLQQALEGKVGLKPEIFRGL